MPPLIEHRYRATVGWWSERALPRVVDRILDTAEVNARRTEACRGLAGTVLELGFGSGLNLPHLPEAVTEVLALEPSETAWRLAQPRIDAFWGTVSRIGPDAQRVVRADASVDAVLTTFTLCTVPAVDAALGEVRRILRPGGRLNFLEHGLAPDAPVQRWQRRLQPVQTRLAGGCQLGRPIDQLVRAAGFDIVGLQTGYAAWPRSVGYLYQGVAAR